MKTICLILTVLMFTSCNKEAFVDERPENQIKFISFVQELRDTVNASDTNKALRNSLLEKNVPAVKTFIKDTLNLSINAWQVKVIEKIEDYLYTGSVQVKLGIAFNPTDTRARAINQSIVLKAVITPANKSVFKKLKSLELNDYIKIDGQFVSKEGFIDIDSYSHYKFSKNILDNPEFNSTITSIEKL